MKQILPIVIGISIAACSHKPENKIQDGVVAQIKAAQPIKTVCEGLAEVGKAPTFADLDADRDGKISKEEYLCRATASFGSLDKNKDNHLSKKEAGKNKIADGNKDGKISIIEFMNSREEVFGNADKDKDGALNEPEYKASKDLLWRP